MERTPDGLDQHEAGAKVDAGKTRLDLVLGGFPHALMGVGEVGTFGANKYTDDGWKYVARGQQRYTDAMLRHYFKYKQGEKVDSDSGLPHLAHLAWNALAILELQLVDDKAYKEYMERAAHVTATKLVQPNSIGVEYDPNQLSLNIS